MLGLAWDTEAEAGPAFHGDQRPSGGIGDRAQFDDGLFIF